MAEYRRDWLSDRWVIIAENRAGRPDEFRAASPRRILAPCPFCRGHEQETPPASATYFTEQPPDDPAAWQVRVIPNKYPAVRLEPRAAAAAPPSQAACDALGAHEVIIESPRHVVTLAALRDEEVDLTFRAYQDRLRHWREDRRLAYGLVFKNARAEGGASLEHSHSQLIATPMVPRCVAEELGGAERFHQAHGRCGFCETLAQELADRRRLVAATENFVAYCPFAGRFPYETWVLPRGHACRFEEERHLQELAHLVRGVVRGLEATFAEVAYNFWIHTAPWQLPPSPFYHWHLEIVTRLTRMAGFEIGAGYFINPVAPEEAASRLRGTFPAS